MYLLADGDVLIGENKNEEICELLMTNNWNDLNPEEIKETKSKLEEYSNLFQNMNFNLLKDIKELFK